MGGNSSRPTVLGSGSQSTLARLTGDKRCEANDKLWKDVFGAGIASPLNQADPSAVHAETAKHCELMGRSPQPSTLGSTIVMMAMMMINDAHSFSMLSSCPHIRVFCTACNNPSTRHLNHLLHLVAARLRRVRSYTAANAILGTVNGLYICRTFIAHLVRASPEDVTLQLNPPAAGATGAGGTTPQPASTPPIVGTAVSATTVPAAAAAAATAHAAVRYSFDDFLRSLLEFVAEVEPRYVHNRSDPAHTLTRAVLRPQQGAV